MEIDLSTTLEYGDAEFSLPNPIIGASGSFGFGPELSSVVDYSKIGAITIKSLAPFVSPGNPAPRIAGTKAGMMNSIGQPGPDIRDWVKETSHEIDDLHGRFIMSFWGKTIEDYKIAAAALAPIQDKFEAIEINLSCPNVHGDGLFFAQIPEETNEIIRLTRAELGDDCFLLSKLTAAVRSVGEIASAAVEAGTSGFTLFNTLLGLQLDPYTRQPILGKGGGGYSGAGILPVVLRGVYEIHKAYPDVPIVGTGGVSTGEEAASMMMCGASAVGVAAATFADPRATIRIAEELKEFCFQTGVANVTDLIGAIEMPA